MSHLDRRVEIIGRHPHAGCRGRLGTEAIKVLGGTPMLKVELDDCDHGAEACYAQLSEIRRRS